MGSAIREFMADVVFPFLAIATSGVVIGWILAEAHIKWMRRRFSNSDTESGTHSDPAEKDG